MSRNIARYRSVLHSSAANYDNTGHLITMCTDIPWISAGKGPEWVVIDLGTVSAIDSVVVSWGNEYAKDYEILLSSDGENWTEAAVSEGKADSMIATPVAGSSRFVKILCKACSGAHYVIRHAEVFGENNLYYKLSDIPAETEDGIQNLTGGNWRIVRASEVCSDGQTLSEYGFDDTAWLPATVPGTALVSYLRAGAIPDPDYDDWQFQISEAFFTADFWYRDRFTVPKDKEGKHVYLNFDAINWKADVFFNGIFLENPLPEKKSSIEGAFMRGHFDVTQFVRFGEENYLAVLIHKNDTPGDVTTQGLAFGPGANGGRLGADNPTLHAAVGWDWLPTIRGRDIGIYGEVSLSYSGEAEIVDPWMKAELELISDKQAIPAENLMLREGVKITGYDGQSEWIGKEDEGFTVDFGVPVTLGSVTINWGSEAGGAAADIESRHPDKFKLETSTDGEHWENFDAYFGGEVELRWIGKVKAEPVNGTDMFEGHSISDSIQGATAIVPIDLTRFGRGIDMQHIFMPRDVRFLRFTVIKLRELNGRPVNTRIREFIVYSENPEQVEQGKKHDLTVDTSKAALTFLSDIRNRSEKTLEAEVVCTVLPGNLTIRKTYTLAPDEICQVSLPALLDAPELWWPNTYGKQFLYSADTSLYIDGKLSDRKTFRFGVRRFDTPIDGGLLTLYCNGVRIVAKGGNWGIDDGLKRDTYEVMDDKVRLHAEANMTMIRNWVGMTSHPGFYEACDKYGILIWDDFWLANPVDGPEPDDPDMFLENAADKIRAIRSHAALTFYCGRNEGNPNDLIHAGLSRLTEELDGTRIYFPHSAAAPVGSGGGYSLAEPGGTRGNKQYFNDVSSVVLRSERGIPNVPNLESLQRFIKPENLWPISESWALHDWTYHMNGPANTYMAALQTYLGGEFTIPVDHVQGQNPREDDPVYQAYKADIAVMCEEAAKVWSVEDFSRAAQLINFDNHRGMFDALGARRSNGLLMWMSQSSWPSFMWQTYDFYLDTNGGYFGTKAGNQPTKAIFDPRDNSIILVNSTPETYANVRTTAEVYDFYGKIVSSNVYETEVLLPDAYGERLAPADFSAAATDIVFLRLTLESAEGKILGENTYWHNRNDYQNYRALSTMAKAEVSLKVVSKEEKDGRICYTLRVQNGSVPALGVRIRLTDKDGAPVLPVFYSDNYLTMMPGECQVITADFAASKLSTEAVWTVSGWN